MSETTWLTFSNYQTTISEIPLDPYEPPKMDGKNSTISVIQTFPLILTPDPFSLILDNKFLIMNAFPHPLPF